MKIEHAARVAQLAAALEELPKMRKQISGQEPSEHYDGYALELSAAEMSDGEGQGSYAYFYIDGEMALTILTTVEDMIRNELAALGVKL